jgi:hypothetical protein
MRIVHRPVHTREAALTLSFSIFLGLFFLILVQGCSPSLEKAKSFKTVFDHYREVDGISAIGFPPGLVGLFLSEDDPEQAELKKLIRELSAFRMLYTDGGTQDFELAGELRAAVSDFTYRNQFEDLFRMQADGGDLFIRIQEKDGFVREAILMMYSEDQLFVVDLRGNISLEHFSGFIEAGHAGALTELADIDF